MVLYKKRNVHIISILSTFVYLHATSTHLLIYSSTHLLIYSSTHLLIYSSTHLLIYSSTHLLIYIYTWNHANIWNHVAYIGHCPGIYHIYIYIRDSTRTSKLVMIIRNTCNDSVFLKILARMTSFQNIVIYYIY